MTSDAMAVYGSGSPWTDGVDLGPRPVRGRTAWEDTPNVTELPVPGDPTPCSNEPDLWHAQAGTHDARHAAQLCKGCWMQKDCAEYGIEHPDEEGVWGGLSMRERRARANLPARRTSRRPARSKRWS